MRKTKISLATIIIAAVGLFSALLYFSYAKNSELDAQVSSLNGQLAALDTKIDVLERNLGQVASSTGTEISELRSAVNQVGQRITPTPTISQDQQIRNAVAAVAPAVTSVVISQLVSDLQVTYVNPFGDNPAFKDIGIRIPVYERKGTTLQKVGSGTGFLVSRDGYIVTNKHVVDNAQAQYTVLLSNGSQVNAQVVYRDPKQDLAIIKIPGTYNAVAQLGDSSTLSLGQSVIAIGNALGEYSNSVTLGIISGLNRTIQASDLATGQQENLSGVIQVDAAINPGNSGGPLIDLNGKVVGITVATVVGSNNIGFAIPINAVKGVIQNVIR